ncbi:uncharacterized protein LOC129760535 [Uranotaenia lowii]|uniref:uncharacterized protein LOC129760535 n=1 Tax=Uranotaenia lowii TaxID=190385 RepID=UPI0024791DF1|nr:uncharacterized protein LOC129760535 [Uranotaenia lowii]
MSHIHLHFMLFMRMLYKLDEPSFCTTLVVHLVPANAAENFHSLQAWLPKAHKQLQPSLFTFFLRNYENRIVTSSSYPMETSPVRNAWVAPNAPDFLFLDFPEFSECLPSWTTEMLRIYEAPHQCKENGNVGRGGEIFRYYECIRRKTLLCDELSVKYCVK